MKKYQEKYIENAKRIAALSVFYDVQGLDFDTWETRREQAAAEMASLKDENIRLLEEGLFPQLDNLLGASDAEMEELTEFASVLMDWKTNLDCGVYVAIHEALLSRNRVKKNRDGVIKELYMLGMGIYYLRRYVEGVASEESNRAEFRNEMIFTEASSYLRYFKDIESTETRGYIIRALHNIALCSSDSKKRIAASAKALSVMQDKYYRDLEPNLPWDRFVRAAHQQMSINRSALSKHKLSQEEITLVLESCYEVFKPEKASANPSVRWLWPYYDMEYCCGYVDFKTTVSRMEQLIDSMPADQYDMSGLYANVQLPLYYGKMMSENPQMQTDADKVRFFDKASRKMLKALLSCPAEMFGDYFFYNVEIAISNFYEIEGSLSYRELATRVLRRFSGDLYVRSRRTGEIMSLLCDAIFSSDPAFFDDIDFIAEIKEPEKKRAAIISYAKDCGLFCDFGLIKMNLTRTMHTRQLFETEDTFYKLHTLSGSEDLRNHKSTRLFADIALGHHSWYNGSGGFPESYIRTESEYRQMTDVAAAASYMVSAWNGDIAGLIADVFSQPADRFSPLVTSFLTDSSLQQKIGAVLSSPGKDYYREIYDELIDPEM